MNIPKIRKAASAAERFLEAQRKVCELPRSILGGYILGSKESGALRRASMDLTRALAEMRSPL